MSARSDDKRWESLFGKFVKEYGVELLASRLHISSYAVYAWIRGRTSPHPAKALAIQRLAKRRGIDLSLDDIYGHFREVRSVRYVTSRRQPQQASV